jgi:hypothetical protein
MTQNACVFFKMKIISKGVKMTQNQSKPWAIVHAKWPTIDQGY